MRPSGFSVSSGQRLPPICLWFQLDLTHLQPQDHPRQMLLTPSTKYLSLLRIDTKTTLQSCVWACIAFLEDLCRSTSQNTTLSHGTYHTRMDPLPHNLAKSRISAKSGKGKQVSNVFTQVSWKQPTRHRRDILFVALSERLQAEQNLILASREPIRTSATSQLTRDDCTQRSTPGLLLMEVHHKILWKEIPAALWRDHTDLCCWNIEIALNRELIGTSGCGSTTETGRRRVWR